MASSSKIVCMYYEMPAFLGLKTSDFGSIWDNIHAAIVFFNNSDFLMKSDLNMLCNSILKSVSPFVTQRQITALMIFAI